MFLDRKMYKILFTLKMLFKFNSNVEQFEFLKKKFTNITSTIYNFPYFIATYIRSILNKAQTIFVNLRRYFIMRMLIVANSKEVQVPLKFYTVK